MIYNKQDCVYKLKTLPITRKQSQLRNKKCMSCKKIFFQISANWLHFESNKFEFEHEKTI